MSSIEIKDQFSPGVLSVLPLFYVGWSDSVLSPTEIKLIHRTLETFDFLTPEDITYLKKYTDPKFPPPPEVFKSWLLSIKEGSDLIEDGYKSSLVELGIKMATAGSPIHDDTDWNAPKTKIALQELEKALGVESSISSQLLFPKISTSPSEKVSTFDASDMKLLLDGEHSELRDRLRKLLRDPMFQLTHIADKEAYRNVTLEQVKSLAEQGVSAFHFQKSMEDLKRKEITLSYLKCWHTAI